MSTHAAALAQSDQLTRISDINLVKFFALEIKKIDRGSNASALLNSSIIRNLIKIGILKSSKRVGRGRGLVLTDKGRDLMKKL